jgi:hypothetical protein
VAVEIALFEVDRLVAGMLVWPWEHAADVLSAYAEWAETAPESVSTAARLLQIPPLPAIPEAFRGRQLVVVDGAVLGTVAEADTILAPLRALEPELDTFAEVPPFALARLHMDPEPPTPGLGDGFVLGSLDADAVEQIVAVAGPGTGSPLVSVELRHLGGALGRRRPGAGALGALEGAFAVHAVGVPAAPGLADAIEARVEALVRALAPWTGARPFLNFADSPVALGDALGNDAYSRLARIKACVDPDGVFRSRHRFEAGAGAGAAEAVAA